MLIRPYRPSDAAALTSLYVRSVRHYGPRAYTSEQVAAWCATANEAKTAARCADGRWVIVAEDEQGRLLGFGDLEDDGHLDFLYAAPEAEGMRVGSALYEALEAHARALRLDRIYVEASELAKPLFERRGFALLGGNDVRLGAVEIHNYRMEKRL